MPRLVKEIAQGVYCNDKEQGGERITLEDTPLNLDIRDLERTIIMILYEVYSPHLHRMFKEFSDYLAYFVCF